MSLLTRMKTTIKEARDAEDMRAAIEKQQAHLEYVALMADIDIVLTENADKEENLNE